MSSGRRVTHHFGVGEELEDAGRDARPEVDDGGVRRREAVRHRRVDGRERLAVHRPQLPTNGE